MGLRLFRNLLNLRVVSSFPHFFTKSAKAMAPNKTIHDFGYVFNNDGQLKKIEANGQPGNTAYEFNISSNHQECQRNYEDLGEAITEYIYEILENQENLIKLPVPVGSDEGTFVFVSEGYDKKDNLLVLIHGSGVVRAGQWARSLIINDSIHSGTQIPYIRRAISNGYGVILLNTNDNERNNKEIQHSKDPEEHAIYVWENYISTSNAKKIAIVAHSYGGVVTLALANQIKDFERVKAVALTDSVHGFAKYKVTERLKEISKNWISSKKPLDSPEKTPEHDISRVSAGHPKHEMTSHSCIESVFQFIEEKLK